MIRAPRRRHVVPALVVAAALVVGLAGCSSDSDGAGAGSGSGSGSSQNPSGGPATSPADPLAVRLTSVAQAKSPVAFAPRPGTTDLYVAEQGGAVRRITVSGQDRDRKYDVGGDAALDLTDQTRAQGEQGLLGLVFSPDGSHLYVDYTDKAGDTHVVEYPMDGASADTDHARELLTVAQPFANHNGGQLAFGPDGFLYIGLGDGGSRDDPDRRAQDPDDLLGKILRIDPAGRTGDLPYAIPAGNPYQSGGGRPEIWISGARNPWRFSFDQKTGDLWVADVGQDNVEEIDFLPFQPEGAGHGANLGWPYYEGTDAYLDTPPEGSTFIEPVATIRHGDGACSVTGGAVYRGTAIPALVGRYVYGDYCLAELNALHEQGDGGWASESLKVSVAANSLSSFGQDLDGEIYALSTEGSIYRLDPA